MKDDDSVVIATFSNEYEANLAVSWLDAEGIETVLLADDAGGVLPMLQPSRGVKLLVSIENEARAREILESAEYPET
jgi:hypothetical protein